MDRHIFEIGFGPAAKYKPREKKRKKKKGADVNKIPGESAEEATSSLLSVTRKKQKTQTNEKD